MPGIALGVPPGIMDDPAVAGEPPQAAPVQPPRVDLLAGVYPDVTTPPAPTLTRWQRLTKRIRRYGS